MSKGDVFEYGGAGDWRGGIDEAFRSDRGSRDPEGGRGGRSRFSLHLKAAATPPNHLDVAPLKHTELRCLLEWTWTTGSTS